MRDDRGSSRRTWPALGGLLLLAAPLAVAAPEQPESTFSETVDVELVNVEVVVTDKAGRPATDLVASDFEVFEDGKPVEVTSFYAVDRRSGRGLDTAPGDWASEGALPPDATRRLHLVLLVDRAGLELAARAALLDSLDRSLDRAFELGGEVMVANLDDGIEVVVPFCRDAGKVRAALAELGKGLSHGSVSPERRALFHAIEAARRPPPDPPGLALKTQNLEIAIDEAARLTDGLVRLAENERKHVEGTVAQVGSFVDTLAGLDGRKAVLFLSGGLAVRPGDGLAEVWREKFQTWLDTNVKWVPATTETQIVRNLLSLESARFDTSRDVAELGRRAAGQRVAFYPVASLAGWGEGAEVGSEAFRAGSTLDSFARESALVEIAGTSGGRAWTRTHELANALEVLASDSESYYSLGYRPGAAATGEFHSLEVKVKRPGLDARYAAGYVAKDAATRLREATLAALYSESAANPLGIHLESGAPEPSPKGGGRTVLPVSVFIPYKGLLLLPDPESHRARLSLIVVVRDVETGRLSEPHEVDLPVRIPNERLAEALEKTAVFPLQLDAGGGPKQIAVGIRDEIARVESSTRIEIR